MEASNQSFHRAPNHTTVQSGTPNEHRSMSEPEISSDGLGGGQSSALDHALLESLFYNEMMMLNASSPSSSNLMAQQLQEATSSTAREAQIPVASDANTIAEKEMLRDFGVTASPMIMQEQPTPRADYSFAPEGAGAKPLSIQSQSITASQTSQVPSVPLAPQHVDPILDPFIPTTSASATLIQPKPMQAVAASTPTLSIEAPVSQERAKQLVDQFATLASRLGIELPNQVLQQLTTAAASNEPSTVELSEATVTTSTQHATAIIDHLNEERITPTRIGKSTINGMPPPAVTVEKLRLTAEQAIAAVTKKRPPGEETEPSPVLSSNMNGSKPVYSKRRKKPRLSDCESKLAQLKAENEVLKRHLQNVSNKAHQIEHGKEESAKQIKLLHDSNAGPEELDKVVKEMTDTYSDYGCNRQQELSFHLEQLSRYVLCCISCSFTRCRSILMNQTSLSYHIGWSFLQILRN